MTPPATTRQPPMRRSCSGGNSRAGAASAAMPWERARAPILRRAAATPAPSTWMSASPPVSLFPCRSVDRQTKGPESSGPGHINTCLLLVAVRRLEVAEELAVRFQDHEVVATGEALAIGPCCARNEELRVLLCSCRHRSWRLRHPLHHAVDGHSRRRRSSRSPCGRCRRAGSGLLATLGTVFTGNRSPLGTHPLIDGAGNFHRQVDLLDAHIHHLDAELEERAIFIRASSITVLRSPETMSLMVRLPIRNAGRC